MSSVLGALVDVQPAKIAGEKPTLVYAQNFTTESSFKGTVIPAGGDTLTLAYDFFPFTSIKGNKNYNL